MQMLRALSDETIREHLCSTSPSSQCSEQAVKDGCWSWCLNCAAVKERGVADSSKKHALSMHDSMQDDSAPWVSKLGSLCSTGLTDAALCCLQFVIKDGQLTAVDWGFNVYGGTQKEDGSWVSKWGSLYATDLKDARCCLSSPWL